MKSFDLHLPNTVDQALALLPSERTSAGAVPLAGGQDLLTELKDNLSAADGLVDLRGIPGLDRLEPRPDGSLEIGALVTVAALAADPSVRAHLAVLAEAAGSVGSPQIRGQGTVGGNLCQRPRCWYYRNESVICLKKGGSECFAYEGMNKYSAILGGGPSYIVHPSDLAPALVALGAEVEIAGPGAGMGAGARRRLPLEKFFTLPAEGDATRENVLAPNELLLSVRVPRPAAGTRGTYLKFRERGEFDWALSSVALWLRVEGGHRIAEARVVLGGVAPIPWRCAKAEELLAGQTYSEDLAKRAAEAALAGAEPLAHNAYKVPLTRNLIRRALGKVMAA